MLGPFLIDGEAIVTNGDGLAVFDLIRHKRYGDAAVLCAFDVIELDGEDLRRSSIEYRKRKLAKLVRRPELGVVPNEKAALIVGGIASSRHSAIRKRRSRILSQARTRRRL